MTDARQISASAQAGDMGKQHDDALIMVEHASPRITIRINRSARKGDPIWLMLSIPEASQMIADLARAVEAEVTMRESQAAAV